MCIRVHPWFLSLAAMALLAAGCATTPRQPPLRLTGDIMVDGPNAISQGPPKDRVLWQYRTAAAAMERGDFAQARTLLDDALLSIGGIVANDRAARQARGLFHEESKKNFIGEPYERAMAYYYRGILYWRDGEPDNARACFRSAAFQDADVENNQYRSDYVLLDYLDGFASVKLRGDGEDAFKRAMENSKTYRPPDYHAAANTLVFVEFDAGPVKYATGEYDQELRFRCAPARIYAAVLKIDGQIIRLDPLDDLCFQATTRGGRVMDHILGNKAVFKSSTDAFGNAAILSGAVLAGHQNRNSAADEVGAGLLVAGLLSKLVSSATTPSADIRSWDNLPHYLSFAALRVPPGAHAASVEFLDHSGHVLPSLTKSLTVNVASDRDTVIFVSDKSTTPQSL